MIDFAQRRRGAKIQLFSAPLRLCANKIFCYNLLAA